MIGVGAYALALCALGVAVWSLLMHRLADGDVRLWRQIVLDRRPTHVEYLDLCGRVADLEKRVPADPEPKEPEAEPYPTERDEYKPNRWRKRPVVVTAERMREPFTTDTMEGTVAGKAGDWLITGVRGEQYPCDDGVFRETYEPAKGGAS